MINRKNEQPVTGSDLDPRVKFAHTWVLARQYGRSRKTIDPGITDEEYLRAFDDEARKLYDYMLATSLQVVECGSFLRPEALAKDLEEAFPTYKYARETALGLYASENRKNSFQQWVSKANLEMKKNQEITGMRR